MTHAPVSDALKLAIDLQHMPSRVRQLRSEPLPGGVPILLSIAAGDERIAIEAAEAAGRSRETVTEAAAFFIEQVLLSPDADSYRVLGADPQATTGELRRNMALLLRWLHPDINQPSERSIFVRRVTLAWNDLKTLDRRAAYDLTRNKFIPAASGNGDANSKRQRFKKSRRKARPRYFRIPLANEQQASPGFLYRLLLFLSGRAKRRSPRP